MLDLTVTIPEDRIADFYTQLARWLADTPTAEPDPDSPLRPLRRPYKARHGRWVWAVDPQWGAGRGPTTVCRYRSHGTCAQQPVAHKLGTYRTDGYCDEHVRHYERQIRDGRVWAWQWREASTA